MDFLTVVSGSVIVPEEICHHGGQMKSVTMGPKFLGPTDLITQLGLVTRVLGLVRPALLRIENLFKLIVLTV